MSTIVGRSDLNSLVRNKEVFGNAGSACDSLVVKYKLRYFTIGTQDSIYYEHTSIPALNDQTCRDNDKTINAHLLRCALIPS